MNTTYGIGGALQSIGGNIMQMAFGNMQDKKIEERKKQAEEAQRLLEESRVARTSKPYMVKGGNLEQGPPAPDRIMVSKYNSLGDPIGQRLADPAEQAGYEQEQAILAQANLAAKEKADAAARKEGREEMKLRSQLARDKASTAASYASAESSRAYAKNLAAPKGPDTFRDESDLSYLISAKEGGELVGQEYDNERNVAVREAEQRGASPEQIRSVVQELTRDYILKIKRLPNKERATGTSNAFSGVMTQ